MGKGDIHWNKRIAKAVADAGMKLNEKARENVDPAKSADMVADLLALMPRKEWMAKWGLGGTAYRQFVDRYTPLLKERKEWLARRNIQIVNRAQELQMKKLGMLEDDEEELKKVNVRDLAMTANMAVQGFTTLTDGNRVIVEHQKGPSLEDAAAVIAAARERARAKLAGQAVEVVVDEVKEVENEQQSTS